MSVYAVAVLLAAFVGSAAAASSQTFAIYGGKRNSGLPSRTAFAFETLRRRSPSYVLRSCWGCILAPPLPSPPLPSLPFR